MKTLQYSVILLLISFYSVGKAQSISQQLVSTAGDVSVNNNFQIEWSIGEIATETLSGGQNTLTQGFHQSTYSITSIESVKQTQFEISAFPNPATDFINLKVKGEGIDNLIFKLLDVTGKVVQLDKQVSSIQQIDMKNFKSGTYFLTITGSDKSAVKTFKIIKSN